MYNPNEDTVPIKVEVKMDIDGDASDGYWGNKVESILESVPQETIDNFQFYNERYYEYKYCIKFPKVGNHDTCLRIHTNKVVLLSLADGNDIVRKQQEITEINFETDVTDRGQCKVRGKRKRGARELEPSSIVCTVKCSDGTVHPIYSGVYGKLIEINEEVLKSPNLLIRERSSVGFLAIIIPNLKKLAVIEPSFLTKDQYSAYLKSLETPDN